MGQLTSPFPAGFLACQRQLREIMRPRFRRRARNPDNAPHSHEASQPVVPPFGQRGSIEADVRAHTYTCSSHSAGPNPSASAAVAGGGQRGCRVCLLRRSPVRGERNPPPCRKCDPADSKGHALDSKAVPFELLLAPLEGVVALATCQKERRNHNHCGTADTADEPEGSCA
jgi:hypothetical protein